MKNYDVLLFTLFRIPFTDNCSAVTTCKPVEVRAVFYTLSSFIFCKPLTEGAVSSLPLTLKRDP